MSPRLSSSIPSGRTRYLGRILKWSLRITGSLLLLLVSLVVLAQFLALDWTRRQNPAGHPVNRILYLTLDDRTKVFVSVWLPPDLQPGQKLPALIHVTRYSHQDEPGWLFKVLQVYTGEPDPNLGAAKPRLDAGFAQVLVQSPGSCQSSGPRPHDYPPSEIEATGLAIDWIVKQPWSNQKVGVYGKSYSGTTADMSCASLRPQLKAVYPKAPDFDPYTGVARPGGVGSTEFLTCWGGWLNGMDANDYVRGMEAILGERMSMTDRFLARGLSAGLKRPSGEDLATFRQALADHRYNPDWAKFYGSLEFKDAPLGGEGSATFDSVALYNYKDRIEQAQVSTYTRAGWMDAGVAEGALQKFLTIRSPQKLVLLPTDHGQTDFVNPYGGNSPDIPFEPGHSKQDMLDYFSRHLKPGMAPKERRTILYYTYRTGTWRETDTWPPRGVRETAWYLAEGAALTSQKPSAGAGADTYTVDFTTTSGPSNRWLGQIKGNVNYGDRREEDRKLLTYTSTPLEADLEVTGSPTLVLHVASTHADGAFHVYFEDVSPDGRVSYLTEGILRAIHRKTRDPRTAPYVPLGVYRTFSKADALPLVPGEVAEIPITLQPISAVIPKGHRLRVAIAGHDAALKDRFPASGTPRLTVHRNAVHPGRIMLPVAVERTTNAPDGSGRVVREKPRQG